MNWTLCVAYDMTITITVHLACYFSQVHRTQQHFLIDGLLANAVTDLKGRCMLCRVAVISESPGAVLKGSDQLSAKKSNRGSSRGGQIGDIPALNNTSTGDSDELTMARLDALMLRSPPVRAMSPPSSNDPTKTSTHHRISGDIQEEVHRSLPFHVYHEAQTSISDNLLRPFEHPGSMLDSAADPPTLLKRPSLGTCPLGGSQAEDAAYEQRRKDKAAMRRLKSSPFGQNILSVYDSQTLTSVRGDSDTQSSFQKDILTSSKHKYTASRPDAPEAQVSAQRFFQRGTHPQAQYYSIKEGSASSQDPQTFGSGYSSQLPSLANHTPGSGNLNQFPVTQSTAQRLRHTPTPMEDEAHHTSTPSDSQSRNRTNSLFKTGSERWEGDGIHSGGAGSSGSRNTTAHLGSQTWMKVFAPSSDEAEGALQHQPTHEYPVTNRVKALDQEMPQYPVRPSCHISS